MVGCSAPRLTPDPFSFTHVRNQMIRCVVAAAAVGEPRCSKVIPPLPSPCKGCLGQGISKPLPWTLRAPAALSRRGEQQSIGWESPKRFLLRQHILRGRKGHGAGAALASSPRSQGRCRPPRFPLVPAQPLQGANQNLASTVVPLTVSPRLPTHPYRSGIYLFSSWVSWFYLLGRNTVPGWAQLDRASRASHSLGQRWMASQLPR